MKHWLISLFILLCVQLNAQTRKPDLHNIKQWQTANRSVERMMYKSSKAVQFNEQPGDGAMWLNGYEFSTGTISFDVKGKNLAQQSFVGIAFHGQNEKTYEAIYFRPFNFVNSDTIRRWRSVQYVAMPDYPWEKLRADFPGKYENKVHPVPDPDDWFHVTVKVDEKTIAVFVNGSTTASLQVERLRNGNGKIGLWVGHNSGGSFANLEMKPF